MTTPTMIGRATEHRYPAAEPVAADIVWIPILMVNTYLVGPPNAGNGNWVLVDAGFKIGTNKIRQAAERRFGRGSRPAAIILTHGHFDHVGALKELAEEWDVRIYAHELEIPYLTGESVYPPPDPAVNGGLMALMSWMYPRSGTDVHSRVRPLPADGSIPGMPGWRWIHTPGHAPGHVSLFRDADRALIAGDAFVTQKQESFWGVLTRYQKVHGPPRYFTPDWDAARESVHKLAALRPSLAATGHGMPMTNPRLDHELSELARHFDDLALPIDGRYVRQPAITDESGFVSYPPPIVPTAPQLLTIAAGIAIGAGIVAALRRRRDSVT